MRPAWVIHKVTKLLNLMKHLVTGASFFFSITLFGCFREVPGPEITGPEPIPSVKLISRDSIAEGSYRGIVINSSTDEVFSVLEEQRKKKAVTYINAVNNYFSDIRDLKNRIHLFEYVALDEEFDTDSGVQLQLESGKIKRIALNNGVELTRWPETAVSEEAIQTGDASGVLYNKLVALSSQTEYAHKFESIVLTTRHTYAIYDPQKASQPWSVVYHDQPDRYDEVKVHFDEGKVRYILVSRFENQ